jgi:hypothetical protein
MLGSGAEMLAAKSNITRKPVPRRAEGGLEVSWSIPGDYSLIFEPQ